MYLSISCLIFIYARLISSYPHMDFFTVVKFESVDCFGLSLISNTPSFAFFFLILFYYLGLKVSFYNKIHAAFCLM
jgi:hypothetical protein